MRGCMYEFRLPRNQRFDNLISRPSTLVVAAEVFMLLNRTAASSVTSFHRHPAPRSLRREELSTF